VDLYLQLSVGADFKYIRAEDLIVFYEITPLVFSNKFGSYIDFVSAIFKLFMI